MNRKIKLPSYCCPRDIKTSGGDKDCDHDCPPETRKENSVSVSWQCSKCGMRTTFGVYE